MTTDREYYRVSSLIKKLLEELFKSLTNLPNLITRLIPLHSLDKWSGYLSGEKILLLPLGNIIVKMSYGATTETNLRLGKNISGSRTRRCITQKYFRRISS